MSELLKLVTLAHAADLASELADDTPHEFSEKYLAWERSIFCESKPKRKKYIVVIPLAFAALMLLGLAIWGVFKIQHRDDHTDISIIALSGDRRVAVSFIPDGFIAVDESHETELSYTVYENDTGESFIITVEQGLVEKGVDTEDKLYDEITIGKHPAFITYDTEIGHTTLIIYFTDCSVEIMGYIDTQTAIKIGESIEIQP